ncbi:hypothetical protein D3C87_1788000 [compost metagenome]
MHRRCPEHKRRRDASRIGYATRGDDRHFHGVDDLRHQGEEADLAAQIVAEEHPAVTTRFITHGDDRITTLLLKPNGFFDGGGRRQDFGPGRFHPIQQGFFRQAEVKTHDFGT